VRNAWHRLVRRWFHSPHAVGQTLVEYGLLIALIAVVAIAALLFLGPIVSGLFNDIGNTINGT
jgi:Flp pilus assembly pilin Flp